MSGNFRREDTPPPAGPRADIIRVSAGHSLQFLCLAERHEGYTQHWIPKGKGYSAPCINPKEDCPHCQAQMPQRWRAYLWVVKLPALVAFGHLELTAGAVRQLETYLGKSSWLGFRVEIRRGAGSTSPLTVMCHECASLESCSRLPRNRPVLPVLTELWEKGTKRRS